MTLVNLVKWGRPLTGEVRPKWRESGESGGIPPISGLSRLFFQRKFLIHALFIPFVSIFVSLVSICRLVLCFIGAEFQNEVVFAIKVYNFLL
jgi:hypothetical protein